MRKWLPRLGLFLLWVAFVDFSVFWIVAVSIGGDALSGKVSDGHYYVFSHGDYAEVSPSTFVYSRVHAIANLVTCFLGAVGLVLLARFDRLALSTTNVLAGRDYVFALIGFAMGLAAGLAFALAIPRLLESDRMRTPWVAIPWFAAIGLVLALTSYGAYSTRPRPTDRGS